MSIGRANHEEDAVDQVAVLNHLLDEHPHLLRYSDLVRELTKEADWLVDAGHHMSRDDLDRALGELREKDAIYSKGEEADQDPWVVPSRTAVYINALPRI
jgi:hypothetical protein